MRVAYLGPPGTYTHEALLASLPAGVERELELISQPSIHETVLSVERGEAERAVVPIENSLEGSVNVTLDTLVHEARNVRIAGEVVRPISHCLIAREPVTPGAVEIVASHPQATAQCAAFLRRELPAARLEVTGSTAAAVQAAAAHGLPWAALGSRAAAERYGCRVVLEGVEDLPGNETRFVWLRRAAGEEDFGTAAGHSATGSGHGGAGGGGEAGGPGAVGSETGVGMKTAIVFWGPGSEAPGWLVRCLREFAERGVNLTRIESRPRRQGLGRYMFFADLEGAPQNPAVASSLQALREHVEELRVLGAFASAGAGTAGRDELP